MNTCLHQITKQIRTHAENRHERFCKKDRRPVKPWRRQKGGKGAEEQLHEAQSRPDAVALIHQEQERL